MAPLIDHDSLDDLIGRVNDLRARAFVDPKLPPFLEELRKTLVLALADLPAMRTLEPASFRVAMTWDGALTLRARGRSVPVNPAYVRHVLERHRIELAPGSEIGISADTARDLIEEALGEVGCEQTRLTALRRELVQFFLLADESEGRTARCA